MYFLIHYFNIYDKIFYFYFNYYYNSLFVVF